MRVLLDYCVPRRLKTYLPEHDVQTAREEGWSALQNGKLLAAVAEAGFVALITVDRNLRYQQNLAALPIAVVVVVAFNNRLDTLARYIPQVNATLASIQPGQLVEVTRQEVRRSEP